MEFILTFITGFAAAILFEAWDWIEKIKHKHEWKVCGISNVLQIDHEGEPYRLCLCKCATCGEREQQWREVEFDELQELETGKSVLLRWW